MYGMVPYEPKTRVSLSNLKTFHHPRGFLGGGVWGRGFHNFIHHLCANYNTISWVLKKPLKGRNTHSPLSVSKKACKDGMDGGRI